MQIFKFGGASIKDAQSVKNVSKIIQKHSNQEILVIISASDKTTNALEKVSEAFFYQKNELESLLNIVKEHHFKMMNELFENEKHPIYAEIEDIFVDLEWILEENPDPNYDKVYDQIVSTGELLSSKIVAAFLNLTGLKSSWLDVRDCILTDNNYRDANVFWSETESKINKIIPELLKNGLVITQGFIGSTSENFTTTLGREGSDYTAAIFSYCLGAESMTIWKDVPGVLNADPRIFKNTVLIKEVSYKEAIEMTYYGAQVIHPKTLKPLENKKIPLFVKSFINSDSEGTIVKDLIHETYPPVIVVKQNQAILNIVSKSFHFIDEERFCKLFELFAKCRIKVNMTQNTALAFSVCINYDESKIDTLLKLLAFEYDTLLLKNLKLISIRHGRENTLENLIRSKNVFLEEKIQNTIQIVLSDNEILHDL